MEFKDSKFLSATEKATLFKQWVRFLSAGCPNSLFTKPIYKDLSLHWGFIAHFNQEGFYISRFERPIGRIDTLEEIAKAKPWVFNDENCSDKGDLHRAMHNEFMKHYGRLAAQAKLDREHELQQQIIRLKEELRVCHSSALPAC